MVHIDLQAKTEKHTRYIPRFGDIGKKKKGYGMSLQVDRPHTYYMKLS